MLASCSFFSVQVPHADTQRKESYKKSQYDNLDPRSKVQEERAVDAFYY